ncbi:MAG: SDR family NAD(P)-dependent oxidoreductase [Promethearchaeota archaeon]
MILEGKNIIITGAGRGIGKAVAIACAKEGANIGLTSRTLSELNETKAEIEKLGMNTKILVKTADIIKYKDVEQCFKEFYSEIGSFYGVIANAGIARKGDSHEFDSDLFSMIINVNILGVFNTFKAAYPLLTKDNKKEKARFIITGSAAYPYAMPKFAAYTASKFGVVGLQKELALEYKRDNLNINMLLPTMVDTQLLRGKKAGNGNKPDNVMNPWDLNDYYIFLLSPEANRVNNELITTSDIEAAIKHIKAAPLEKKVDWRTYLEETASKVYTPIKKQGKLIDFLMFRN